jgi:deoxyribodipyrimidine photo-lyase
VTISTYGIHWFRRDLRVAGNPSLHWNRREHAGRVLGIFCIDSAILNRPDYSNRRFAFFLKTLQALQEEMRSIGSDLLVMDASPTAGFEELFFNLKNYKIPLPSVVSFNRDYEPFARSRDEAVEHFLKSKYGIQVHSERDHVLIEPHEVLKQDGTLYQVYTPFSKSWLKVFRTPHVQERIQFQKEGLKYLKRRAQGHIDKGLFSLTWTQLFKGKKQPQDHLDEYLKKIHSSETSSIPPAGSLAALKRLSEFKKHLENYRSERDFPGIDGTSKMSIYIKNGSFVPSQLIAELELESENSKSETGSSTYLRQVIWREFYYQILFHRPDVEKGPFLKKYQKIKWENREDLFEAWKKGRTGYPIVDAGMRQMNQTGWMHNRVRMIVASFLCKDLLINWQWGEVYFMNQLLDGDLALNNGGWQWAASTGCDPQPYFRIFNPELQSKRFDPEGTYIRKYVPELKNVSNREIHRPQNPIVEHASRKFRALQLYSV